jgi:hypothetical protein
MKIRLKPSKSVGTKKEAPSVAGHAIRPAKKAATSNRHREPAGGELVQLRKADKMLTRIERKGEALSASADRLLRRLA